jgi:hypothetical protein
VNRTTRLLLHVALAVLAGYLILFVGLAVIRLTYPFDIEWMEGGMMTHAARLLAGQPIYAAPSADFVPFFYTPGYPALLAGLSHLTGGLGYGMARGVSLVATLITLAVLYRIGRREGGHWQWGLLAAGLYAALFRVNGAFYDLARPDALFSAILVGAVYCVYYGRSWRGVLAASVLFALGFFTKQTVSVFVPVCALYLLSRDWRHAVGFGVLTFGLAAGGIYLINGAHDGWFWTYIFEGHQGHLFYWKNILLEYWRDLLVVAPLLLLLPLLWFRLKVGVPILAVVLAAWWTFAWLHRARGFDYDAPHMYYVDLWYYSAPRWRILVPSALLAVLLFAFRRLNPRPIRPQAHGFWLLMFIAGVGASGLNHSTQWAYSNSLMLLSLFASVLIALAVRDLLQPVEGPPRAGWLIPVALLVQLGAWVYDPMAQIPRAADREALVQLDEILQEIRGPVLVTAHPFYAAQRNGQVHLHQMGIQDVVFLGGVKDLPTRLRRKEWGAVVLDEQTTVPGLETSYFLARRFRWPTDDALRMKTGFLTRPAELWLPQGGRPRDLVPGLNADFEQAGYSGWISEGAAFGTRPTPRPGAFVEGAQVARSDNGGPQATGRLSSIMFSLPAERLSFLLGGSGGGKVAVRVDHGQSVLARIGGNSRRARPERVTLDLTGHRGKEVVIRLIDDDPKGDLLVDDFRFE